MLQPTQSGRTGTDQIRSRSCFQATAKVLPGGCLPAGDHNFSATRRSAAEGRLATSAHRNSAFQLSLVKHLDLAVNDVLVRQAQQLGHLPGQSVFMFVQSAVRVNDAPEAFHDIEFFFA